MTAADHDLVAAVRAALAAAGDPGRAPQMQAYMRSAMPYRGVRVPEVRALCRPLFAARPLGDRAAWEATVRELWDAAAYREERYAATALTGHRAYAAYQDPAALPLYEHLVVTGAWWDHVDEVAIRRIGPILRAYPDAVGPVLRGWAADDDLWRRRTAVIAQVTAGAATDLDLLRDCLAPNLAHRDFFVRKAIGWALRDLARTDAGFVRAYVAAHRAELSPLSLREATRHL